MRRHSLAVVGIALAGLSAGCSAEITVVHDPFERSDSIPVGVDAWRIAAGDFDGDGHLDLATIGYASGAATVLLGRGDGRFDVAGTYSIGSRAAAIVVGDFDGDGALDLAVATGDSIGILRGRGDGSFETLGDYPMPELANALAAGDLDGDGRLDLVVGIASNAIAGGDTGFVVLSGGDGGVFQVGPLLSSTLNPGFVALVDVDGDGHLDLMASGDATNPFAKPPTGLLRVRRGLGDGTFGAEVASAAGASARVEPATNFALGDFDGDGILDTALMTGEVHFMNVLTGRGDGTFRFRHAFATDASPGTVVSGDFDGDGNVDLIQCDQSGLGVGLWLGRGDGTFELAPRWSAEPIPFGMVVGDFNGDGKPDLATANSISKTVDVFLNALK